MTSSQVIKKVEAITTDYAHAVCITRDGGSVLLVARRYTAVEEGEMVWTFPWEKMRAQDSCKEVLATGLMKNFSNITFTPQKPFLERNISENMFSSQPSIWNHFCAVMCSEYRDIQMKHSMWQKFCWIHPHQISGMLVSSVLRDESDESSPFHPVSRVTQKILKETVKKGGGSAFKF